MGGDREKKERIFLGKDGSHGKVGCRLGYVLFVGEILLADLGCLGPTTGPCLEPRPSRWDRAVT